MKQFFSVVTCLLLATFFMPIHAADVLLVPESTGDTVGMYDPFDGTYLGDLITGYAGFSTPINAIQGPDDNIYVSDQLTDAVYVFDSTGTYLSTYADDTDGLNNVRGIDFRDGWLYITSGDDFVLAFSAPHTRETDFINDGTDPFDILFLADGSALLSDIAGSTDNVRYYNDDGTLNQVIFNIDFPEQTQFFTSDSYINAGFSAGLITVFDMTGIISQIPFSGVRGVYPLGNGNILATNGDGVHEVDPASGTIINTVRTGVSARFIELADVDLAPTPTPTPMEPTPTPMEPTPTPTGECIHHGDATLDGAITAGDAQLTFLFVLGSQTPTFEEACAADCNGDEEITAGDAQQIFMVALGSASCVDPLI